MIKYLFRHDKDYSRFNIIKQLVQKIQCDKDIYILLPFSKNQFFKHFFKRDKIINDFFISNYDTYVYDRQKITKKNPRAWWKYFQDWFNFRFSKYLLSDTSAHFHYWEELFGKFRGKHLVLPVLADKTIYYPLEKEIKKSSKVKILFFGSFIPLHGIDIILKAFKIMENNGIDFEAKIIGKGQNFPQMKQLFEQLGLKQVQMDGEFIQEVELAKEIRTHDIILGIFGDSKKAKSVVPNKVYQAVATKKVIVTMNSNTVREFFEEDEVIMCDNTPSILAEQLKVLIQNPEYCKSVASKGYHKFLSLYDKAIKDLENFVNSIN